MKPFQNRGFDVMGERATRIAAPGCRPDPEAATEADDARTNSSAKQLI
jgi:hypothetical protein